MAITLQNSTATPALYLPPDETGGWFAYLLPQSVTAAASFPLDATWTMGVPSGSGPPGYYLFCPQAPQNPVAFVQNAWAYFSQNGYTGATGNYPYFVWIHEPDTVGLDPDVMVVTSGYPNPKVSSAGANLRLGSNYILFVNVGANVIANLSATPPAFLLNGQNNQFTANGLQLNGGVSNTMTL